MCHGKAFFLLLFLMGRTLIAFPGHMVKPCRGRHMHDGMSTKMKTDTRMSMCTAVNSWAKAKAYVRTRPRTHLHKVYLSVCFTALLWLAGGLWPSAVLQRQFVMCHWGGGGDNGGNGRRRRKRKKEVEVQTAS